MSLIELTDPERRQLAEVLHRTDDAHLYRRTLAVLLVDRGGPVDEVAEALDVHRSNVYRWADAFASACDPRALLDRPGRGRPTRWGRGQQSALLSLLKKSPQNLGYPDTLWNVPLLSRHLRSRGIGACSCSTLRRQLGLVGWSWKRARHVLDPDPEREKKTLHP